jgi:hypothetical protein
MKRVVTHLLTLGLLAALCLPVMAGGQKFGPNANGGTEFMAPSGNIGCIYIPAGGTDVYKTSDGGAELSCDRVEPSYVRVMLGDSGKAERITNVGDPSCCGGDNIFEYGEVWSEGPFSCISATTGLTCTRGTHGFSLSRKAVKVY